MTENMRAEVSLSRTALRILTCIARASPPSSSAKADDPVNTARANYLLSVFTGSPPSRGRPVLLLLRLLRAFDRRQRFDVGCHGVAVLGRKLRGIAHHRCHRAADRVAIRRVARLEDVGDVLLGIILQRSLRDVRDPALA